MTRTQRATRIWKIRERTRTPTGAVRGRSNVTALAVGRPQDRRTCPPAPAGTCSGRPVRACAHREQLFIYGLGSWNPGPLPPPPPPPGLCDCCALAGCAPRVSLTSLVCPPRLTVSVTVSPGE